MVSVTIRNVPDATRDELAARAARAGQSLQEYMLGVLERESLRQDPQAFLRAHITRLRHGGSTLPEADVVATVREDREGR